MQLAPMSAFQKQANNKKILPVKFREKIQQWLKRVRELHGDPHYVAMGMAVGVFVSLTPTIPLHTALAVSLAFILRGSKAAAAIAVWLSNPLTIPIFYFASYKTGAFLFGRPAPDDVVHESVTELLKLGLDVTVATIIGGALLGILPAVATYFTTRKILVNLRARKTSFPKKVCNNQF